MLAKLERNQPLQGVQVQPFANETCDLTCGGCSYAGQTKEEKKLLQSREMPPEKWNEINSWLYEEGVRMFCIMGGEPGAYKVGGVPKINEIVEGIAVHPDAFVLLSTTGVHMLRDDNLRERVAKALTLPGNRQFNNGIAISFDGLPGVDDRLDRSRAYKAREGLELVRRLREEGYGDQITFVANVMVTRESLPRIPQIQNFLEGKGVWTNLCTQQVKCFGKRVAIFNVHHMPELTMVAAEMIRRKIDGKLVVPSIAYLSQLPGVIGKENYKCWEEPKGSPVLDVGPDGKVRFCNWVGQKLEGGPPGVEREELRDGDVTWDEFWARSQETTKMLCGGCSWSRRNRGLPDMVKPNMELLLAQEIPLVDPSETRFQNLWVQAQQSVSS